MDAPAIPELSFVEGDQDVQYVLIDVQEGAPPGLLSPGTQVTFKDLHTENPTVAFHSALNPERDTAYSGNYEETVGSVLFFESAPADSGQLDRYKCHTETVLKLRPIPAPAAPADGAAAP